MIYSEKPLYLLLAAVDLPFFLGRQGEHGLPVLLCEIQFILQGNSRENTALTECCNNDDESKTGRNQETEVSESSSRYQDVFQASNMKQASNRRTPR